MNTKLDNPQESESLESLDFFEKLSLRYLLGSRPSQIEHISPRAEASIKKPIFVVGCPRSGTTVIGSCLIAHSKLAGSDESLFLIDMWRIFSNLHQGHNSRNWAPLRNYMSGNQLIEYMGQFCDSVFGALIGEKRYVDHTPWYVGLIPLINLIYPDAIFLHVIRNGLDVVSSLASSFDKGFWWAGKDTEERVKLWNTMVVEGIQSGRELPKERYLEVYYEKFCEAPKENLEQILKFLDLNFEDNCLIPLTIPHVEPSRKNATVAYFDANQKLVINPSKSSNATREFNLEDIKIFKSCASEAIKLTGYAKIEG